MEVLIVITSNKEVVSLFESFIYSVPMLELVGKDSDTAFFRSTEGRRDKLYYHFELNDVSEQFKINFNDAEVIQVKNFFGEKEIYMFDLSYALESTISHLFKDFKHYLTQHEIHMISEVLLDHPFDGIKSLESDY